ncbi:MAG: hypothetical protein QNJ41_05260, partial [Xenococcaceae cyanobacterium MO_188.B32]|nr:hypothetical protein [Xenococcaceae cyanobacterium MO_188.B32]
MATTSLTLKLPFFKLEDLSNLRKTSKQRKKNKSDAAQNRDFWCYFQLENFIFYKAELAGI